MILVCITNQINYLYTLYSIPNIIYLLSLTEVSDGSQDKLGIAFSKIG